MEIGKSMKEFSGLEIVMERFRKKAEETKQFQPVAPWPKALLSKKSRTERKRKAKKFWEFDRLYFPQNMYSEGYARESKFHHELVEIASYPGIHVILGARKHGKTATMKKFFVWKAITGQITFGATLSQTLITSRNILADINSLIFGNERILYDFDLELIESNADQITFRVNELGKTVRIGAFSEGRSMRGATHLFDRPQFVLCDDLETRQSPMGEEQVVSRLHLLWEAYHSLAKNGTIVVLGNNFDENCALNRLLLQQKENLLPEHIRVYVFPAWSNGKPLWKERYPAKSEEELRKMLEVADEGEWQGDFQQNPIPPEGIIFRRPGELPVWHTLPDDARGVIYCDPNLAKKGRGDTTAIVSLLYSPSADRYFLSDFVCRSFADSNELLDVVLSMKKHYHRAIGFDGNVSQESTWTNLVRNWCWIRRQPFPRIEYCRYNVDELAKNMQGVWNEGRILLPEDITRSEEGKRFLGQFFSFQGKKANRKDDAADAMICAFELLHERRLGKRISSKFSPVTFRDFYGL